MSPYEVDKVNQECEIASMMIMAGYKERLNLDVLFSFIPFPSHAKGIEDFQVGDIMSVKRGEGVRGAIITDTKPFPHSLTVYLKTKNDPVNIALWNKKHTDENELEYYNAKICGIKNTTNAEDGLDILFRVISQFLGEIYDFIHSEEVEDAISFLELNLTSDNGVLELSKTDRYPKEINFMTRYLHEFSDKDEYIGGFRWLLNQDIEKVRPERLFLTISLLNLTFYLPFSVDYSRFRDNINDMYHNRLQRDFYVVYLENQDPNCVVHGRSPDPMKIFVFQIWSKSNCTRVMVKSPGFQPTPIIEKFWDLVSSIRPDIELDMSIPY